MGLKFARNKTVLMSKRFKFLGFEFNNSSNSILAARRNNFKNMRNPRSQAERISRLGAISYFEETLPQLRKIAAPLFHVVKGGKFQWGRLENSAWEAIKTLISLEFENCPSDSTKPLFITVDSSQIATCYLLF